MKLLYVVSACLVALTAAAPVTTVEHAHVPMPIDGQLLPRAVGEDIPAELLQKRGKGKAAKDQGGKEGKKEGKGKFRKAVKDFGEKVRTKLWGPRWQFLAPLNEAEQERLEASMIYD